MNASWTQRDAHGSLYVYIRGQLVLKTWPNGTERLFNRGLGDDVLFLGSSDSGMPWHPGVRVEKSKVKLYTKCEVYLNGVLLTEEPKVPHVSWKWSKDNR